MQKNERGSTLKYRIGTYRSGLAALVNESLRKLLDDPVFSVGLERLGLRTSAAFVRFGSQLSWPTASISML